MLAILGGFRSAHRGDPEEAAPAQHSRVHLLLARCGTGHGRGCPSVRVVLENHVSRVSRSRLLTEGELGTAGGRSGAGGAEATRSVGVLAFTLCGLLSDGLVRLVRGEGHNVIGSLLFFRHRSRILKRVILVDELHCLVLSFLCLLAEFRAVQVGSFSGRILFVTAVDSSIRDLRRPVATDQGSHQLFLRATTCLLVVNCRSRHSVVRLLSVRGEIVHC